MSTIKVIQIDVESKDAQKEVNDLAKDFSKLQDEVDGLNKELGQTGDAAKKGAAGTKTLATGFKAVGAAFKAIGIGIIIALFAKLGEILTRNQKVVDFFSTAMTTLEIAFNDLFDFVVGNFMPTFEKLKKFFEELTFDKIATAIKENLIERFNSLLDVLGYVGTAFKELFAGNFDGALDAIGNAGKEMVDVMTGIPDTVDKTTKVIVDATNAIIDYTKETYNQADAITKTANAAEIAAAQQAKIIAQAVLDADALRLIRDDETKSIEVRKQASKDLKDVLDKQAEATTKQAELQLAAAANQLALNNSTENRVALIQAETNAIDVVGQVTGLYNEQMAAENGLTREGNDLKAARIDKLAELSQAEADLAFDQAEFEANQIENELLRLEEYKRINEEKSASDILRLEAIIENDEANAEQKEEAQIRLDEIKQAAAQKEIDLDNEIADVKEKNAEEEKALRQNVKDFTIDLASQTLSIVGSLAKKGSALAKGVAVAQATIDTYKGAVAAYAAGSSLPGPIGLVMGPIAAGLAVAAGLVNIKKILSTKPDGGGAPSGGGGASLSSAPPPAFTAIGTQGATTDGQGDVTDAVNRTTDTPVRAYVVTGEVTTRQALERNSEEGGEL